MTEFDHLISQVAEDHTRQRKQVEEPLSINMLSTTEVNGQFVFSQVLLDYLLQMKSDQRDRDELISRCRTEYVGNRCELTRIDEFQTSYSSAAALWWYTRESFLYRTLNAALRTQNIHMMFLYRSLIRDLHDQLRQCPSPVQENVYRGQLI